MRITTGLVQRRSLILVPAGSRNSFFVTILFVMVGLPSEITSNVGPGTAQITQLKVTLSIVKECFLVPLVLVVRKRK